jgi:hypothetical protein
MYTQEPMAKESLIYLEANNYFQLTVKRAINFAKRRKLSAPFYGN